MLHHGIAQPHALSHRFKAGGRHRIDNVLFLQGCIGSRGLHAYPVGIFSLVGIQRGTVAPFSQIVCRPCGQFGDFQVVRRDKGTEQFRIKGRPVPFVKGKGGGVGAVFRQGIGATSQPDCDASPHPLGQFCQISGVCLYIQTLQRILGLGRDLLDLLRKGQQHGRGTFHGQCYTAERRICMVLNGDLGQNRQPVLL